jgi:hypothetical protein
MAEMLGVSPRDILQDAEQTDEAEPFPGVHDKRVDRVSLGPNVLLHAVQPNSRRRREISGRMLIGRELFVKTE